MSAYFTPGTVFWRVNSDALVNLAGSRALMLELAHPLVAAGVAGHSNYRGDPFGRLMRTMSTMSRLMFTGTASVDSALRHFNGCHARVHGALEQAAGPLPGGAHYDARDPLLKLWVLATLYDSCLLVYDTLVAPLSPADRRDYYGDGLALAELLGIPRGLMPPTYEAFDVYVQTMIAGDLLTVSDQARDIAAALWAAPVFGAAARLASFVGIGLLPVRIRTEFGYKWGQVEQARLERLAGFTRRARPLVPALLSRNPQALWAEWRWRLRPGARPRADSTHA